MQACCACGGRPPGRRSSKPRRIRQPLEIDDKTCEALKSDVTKILIALDERDDESIDPELRQLAVHKLSHEGAGHTLQATVLWHETQWQDQYLELRQNRKSASRIRIGTVSMSGSKSE